MIRRTVTHCSWPDGLDHHAQGAVEGPGPSLSLGPFSRWGFEAIHKAAVGPFSRRRLDPAVGSQYTLSKFLDKAPRLSTATALAGSQRLRPSPSPHGLLLNASTPCPHRLSLSLSKALPLLLKGSPSPSTSPSPSPSLSPSSSPSPAPSPSPLPSPSPACAQGVRLVVSMVEVLRGNPSRNTHNKKLKSDPSQNTHTRSSRAIHLKTHL